MSTRMPMSCLSCILADARATHGGLRAMYMYWNCNNSNICMTCIKMFYGRRALALGAFSREPSFARLPDLRRTAIRRTTNPVKYDLCYCASILILICTDRFHGKLVEMACGAAKP